MRVSYTWLRELVEIPYTAKELGEVLTQQGMAVDALEHWGRPYEGIVVGVIKGVAKHPSADNLSICQVDVGREVLQVVCGAPNVGVGQHVAVAQVGARIGDRMIERTKVRGVESEGMCCAADELGISGDHSGLLILDASFGAGTPLERVVSGEDYIFELDIANNRPDLLCHIGIAREIWAHLRRRDGKGGEYQPPRFELEERGGAVGDAVRVEVEDMALCPRYTARVVEEVRIGPSPVWMQARLYRLGMRPINNVVDITNYVMLEYGHPLHAFDGEQLEGRRIVVRRARRGERLVTLDGVERELDEGMIVIADEARGVAIAGVMGGENTEVRATTRQIVLESAYFEPGTIRRAAKLLGLHSESSRRFERGVRGAAVEASARAAQLMSLYAGGVVRRGMLDVGGGEKKRRVRVRLERCEGLLGMKLAGEAVEKTLRTLGFGCEDVGGSLVVSVPEHRVDVVEEADIAEEIARVWGYQGVPIDAGTPFRSNVPVGRVYACRAILRELLAAEGLYEAYNPSLVSEELLSRAGVRVGDHEQGLVALANATTQEQSVLRTAVYPGLLRNVQHNIARGAKSVRLFELGRVYRR
ncbi:MAG: phenylalanine--tRNA ligase subunit beta, partial [bacterium]|nr:phenylalanine--tRNA ligase subunit beta [bacterium]